METYLYVEHMGLRRIHPIVWLTKNLHCQFLLFIELKFPKNYYF
jgi:hypothetical protein